MPNILSKLKENKWKVLGGVAAVSLLGMYLMQQQQKQDDTSSQAGSIDEESEISLPITPLPGVQLMDVDQDQDQWSEFDGTKHGLNFKLKHPNHFGLKVVSGYEAKRENEDSLVEITDLNDPFSVDYEIMVRSDRRRDIDLDQYLNQELGTVSNLEATRVSLGHNIEGIVAQYNKKGTNHWICLTASRHVVLIFKQSSKVDLDPEIMESIASSLEFFSEHKSGHINLWNDTANLRMRLPSIYYRLKNDSSNDNTLFDVIYDEEGQDIEGLSLERVSNVSNLEKAIDDFKDSNIEKNLKCLDGVVENQHGIKMQMFEYQDGKFKKKIGIFQKESHIYVFTAYSTSEDTERFSRKTKEAIDSILFSDSSSIHEQNAYQYVNRHYNFKVVFSAEALNIRELMSTKRLVVLSSLPSDLAQHHTTITLLENGKYTLPELEKYVNTNHQVQQLGGEAIKSTVDGYPAIKTEYLTQLKTQEDDRKEPGSMVHMETFVAFKERMFVIHSQCLKEDYEDLKPQLNNLHNNGFAEVDD